MGRSRRGCICSTLCVLPFLWFVLDSIAMYGLCDWYELQKQCCLACRCSRCVETSEYTTCRFRITMMAMLRGIVLIRFLRLSCFCFVCCLIISPDEGQTDPLPNTEAPQTTSLAAVHWFKRNRATQIATIVPQA